MRKEHEIKRQTRLKEFLGMTHGRANYTLHRRLLYSLVDKYVSNNCFRCGLPMTYETFSIDHKTPWLHADKEVFFDMDNIAYSHRSCNASHARKGDNRKHIPPEGKAWCFRCKTFVDLSLFKPWRHKGQSRTVRWDCTPCRRAHDRLRDRSKNKGSVLNVGKEASLLNS